MKFLKINLPAIVLAIFMYYSWSVAQDNNNNPMTSNVSIDNFSTENNQSSLQMSRVSVAVTGSVLNSGTYSFKITDRVDRAIIIANQSDRTASSIEMELKSQKLPSDEYRAKQFLENNVDEKTFWKKERQCRKVLLYRRTGEVIKVDIAKYYALRDNRWNPTLQDGDIIFVPKKDEKNVIAVYGGVNVPGQIEFADSDRVADAIQLAYGFTPKAIIDSIILNRYDIDQKKLTSQVIRWSQILKSPELNIFLQPGDRLVVFEREDLRKDYHVTVSGEIRFPGVYPIARDRTKLSTVIAQAGGPTSFAALGSASIYRGMFTQEEMRYENLLSMRGNKFAEDTMSLQLENGLKMYRSIVNVDLQKLLQLHDTTQEIYLCDEDKIVIPQIVQTVYVYGQVVHRET